MSVLFDLTLRAGVYLFVGALKTVWYGGKYIIGCKTEQAVISEQLQLITDKLDKLAKEEKKLGPDRRTRQSI